MFQHLLYLKIPQTVHQRTDSLPFTLISYKASPTLMFTTWQSVVNTCRILKLLFGQRVGQSVFKLGLGQFRLSSPVTPRLVSLS